MIVTKELLGWIRDRMSERGWDMAELARHTKTSRTGWGRILNGESHSLRAKSIMDLCEVFGMDEIELYRVAHPEMKKAQMIARESGRWPMPDSLPEFIRLDLLKNTSHRPAYEAVATAFGFKKD